MNMDPGLERERRSAYAAEPQPEMRHETYKVVTTGSILEAVGGIAAGVLGILGLVGFAPMHMAAIAAMAFGVGLTAEGAAVASKYSELTHYGNGAIVKSEVGGGSGAELLGGLAGGVLGLLALLGIAPLVLVSVAVIVFGASLLLGSASTARLGSAVSHFGEHDLSHASMEAAAGAEVLVGLATIALGILSLVGIEAMTLVLAALLSLGVAAIIAGTAIGGSLVSVFSH
jgi:hypothetical protein